MRGKFRKERRYVKHLIKKSPEKTDNRAVNKRHEQRSEADTDKFSEKQQRHHTADRKTRQVKASLEKRPLDMKFRTYAFDKKVLDLRIQIGFVKAGNRQRREQNAKHIHSHTNRQSHTARRRCLRIENRHKPP